MADIQDLNVVDASNTARWPEGMAPSGINDAGRADEGILARWFNDWNGSITSSGSSNAYAITSNRTIGSLSNGIVMWFTSNHTNTGAATLNLNGLGVKDIKRQDGSALAAGDIVSGQMYCVTYRLSADDWFLLNPSTAGAATTEMKRGEIIAIIEDQKAQNTSPQTLTAATDNVRTLNTLAYNRDTLVSLASNRFTLPAGTWEVEWSAPIYSTFDGAVLRSQSFLYNQSDATEVARGEPTCSEEESSQHLLVSRGRAVVTIAASKAFEIRHRPSSTAAGGEPANLGTEIYTRVAVRRA